MNEPNLYCKHCRGLVKQSSAGDYYHVATLMNRCSNSETRAEANIQSVRTRKQRRNHMSKNQRIVEKLSELDWLVDVLQQHQDMDDNTGGRCCICGGWQGPWTGSAFAIHQAEAISEEAKNGEE